MDLQTRITDSDVSITVNDITVSYKDQGDGNIPIIFIHGFPFSYEMWNPQIDFFRKTHRVIAYDIRGFGRSTAGSTKPTIDLYADDLIGFMDALNIHKSIICGLSMGGYIVLNAIYRYPERFSGIVLSDTQCIADTAEVKEKRFESIAQIEERGKEDFASSFVKNAFSELSQTKKLEAIEEIKDTILSTSNETITAALKALAERQEMCATLPNITVPTLVICGEQDKVTPVKQAEFLVTNIGSAEIKIIEGAGHLSNLEQPEVFNQSVADFVGKLIDRPL